VDSIFPTSSKAAGFDPATNLALATAAGLAYQGETIVRRVVEGMGGSLCWIEDKETDTQCFVAANGNAVVVSFRGSTSLRDWITDAQFKKIDWRIWFGVSSITYGVHKGFAEAVDSVSHNVSKAIYQLRDRGQRIYFTGHSLGADLAMMMAFRWKYQTCDSVNNVYAFAGARWCNGRTAGEYDDLLGDVTFRVTNSEDPVPRIPGVLLGYRHVGQEVYFDDCGEMAVNPPLWRKLPGVFAAIYNAWHNYELDFLEDHNVEKYRSLAQGLVNSASQISDFKQ